MKKSNVIITVVLAAVSIFLLALWYMLGFNEIDSPLDLVISVVWWAVIVAGIAVAAKTESTRRQRIRTVYVADGAFYNSEAGNRILAPGVSATEAIAGTLASLQYGFDKADAPTKPGSNQPVDYRYVVRSTKFDQNASDGSGQQSGAQDGGTWQGEVVTVATGDVRPLQQQARAGCHHRLARTKRPAALAVAGRLTRSTSSLRLDGGAGVGPTPTHLSSRDSNIPARVVYVRKLRPCRPDHLR